MFYAVSIGYGCKCSDLVVAKKLSEVLHFIGEDGRIEGQL